jgi:hypothetical protein
MFLVVRHDGAEQKQSECRVVFESISLVCYVADERGKTLISCIALRYVRGLSGPIRVLCRATGAVWGTRLVLSRCIQ